jgi:hypothetical protein
MRIREHKGDERGGVSEVIATTMQQCTIAYTVDFCDEEKIQ